MSLKCRPFLLQTCLLQRMEDTCSSDIGYYHHQSTSYWRKPCLFTAPGTVGISSCLGQDQGSLDTGSNSPFDRGGISLPL